MASTDAVLIVAQAEPQSATETQATGAPSGDVSAPTSQEGAASAAQTEEPASTVDVTAAEIDPFEFAGFDLQQAYELVEKGGPVVVILLVMSVLALTVTLLKLFQFTFARVGSTGASDRALSLWIAGRPHDAYKVVSRSRAPNAVALAAAMRGMLSGVDRDTVREDVERVAMAELSGLRSYMRVLDSTVQIAPLLGLFGTVLGMISAFQALQNAGADADPTVLAGGIWVALMTTAVGLAVAIPMAFVNTWFEGRIEREKTNIEAALTSLFTRRATDGFTEAAANDPGVRIPANAAE